jgi:hypothetical protein
MRKTLDLAGEWRIALDRDNTGIREKWFATQLKESISLPGTTDEAGLGDFTDERCADRLSRLWRWIGPAWYQRSVTIPRGWKGKRISLFLERTKDSQVWVDKTWVGSDDSLSTPHVFDLSKELTPGKHTLTILVDNAKLPPVGPCHQVDERTQTNWNGILGRIELIARENVWIEGLQAYPNLESARSVRVVATMGNAARWKGDVKFTLDAEVVGQETALSIPSRRFKVAIKGKTTRVELDYTMPGDVPLWDEFDRPLIRLMAKTSARVKDAVLRDAQTIDFGIRDFVAKRGQFVINGRPTFFRGKNDGALFPLTGYAPMEKEEWVRLLSIARNYGINHYRFHSWCPPEAAFAAADEVGIYFQVELPNKRGITEPDNLNYSPPAEAYETLVELEGDDDAPAVRTAYLTREGERILQAFGNHPSFMMLTLGNELGGDEAVMKGMCDHFRALDGRHLYAMGTGHWHWDLKYRDADDFWVTRGTGASPDLATREASWEVELHVDHKPPSTMTDYRAALDGVPVPVVGHETGQFEVYPDYREIKKYTGILKAHNLEIFRERLKAAGMLDQATAFFRASGALSALCYREGVEAALRTPGFGGFQMLDLQDFSGQGTALVGMLNVFMESKGLITPKAWREFCCETVPLLGMRKYTWTNDETFQARIRLAHYGPTDLAKQSLVWQIRAEGKTVVKGETRSMDIPTGVVSELDLIRADLGAFKKPQKLVVTLRLKGTRFQNRYDLWVYPAKVPTASPKRILVARSFSKKVQVALAGGARVLLLAKPEKLKRSVATAFQSSFWSPMFRKGDGICPTGKETPAIQGILCDPNHPMFKDFPTESHSNWQWWQLIKNSRPMILDDAPAKYRPTLQVIDTFARNHKLGLICEAKVGKGRLLICSIDLPALQKHPEARQLLASIHRYVKSTDFKPGHELDAALIRSIV